MLRPGLPLSSLLFSFFTPLVNLLTLSLCFNYHVSSETKKTMAENQSPNPTMTLPGCINVHSYPAAVPSPV